MKIEFTKEEVEAILLAHANQIVKTEQPFNKVDCSYSYIPEKVSVLHEPTKEETE